MGLFRQDKLLRPDKGLPTVQFSQVGYTILILLAVLLTGIGSIITAGFQLREFATPSFWVKTATLTASNLFIVLGMFKRRLHILKNNHGEYNSKRKFLSDFSVEGQKPTFRKFLDTEYNLPAKIRAWKNRMIRKRVKLLAKDYKLFKKRRSRKRDLKVDRINEKLTDSWINDNILYIRVRYFYIAPSDILNNYKPKKEGQPFESEGRYLFRNLTPKFLLSFGGTLFMAGIFIQPNKLGWESIMNIVIHLTFLVANATTGDDFAFRFFEEQILGKINYYIEVIKNYFIWEKRGEAHGSEGRPSVRGLVTDTAGTSTPETNGI